jgi:hypothetical protein
MRSSTKLIAALFPLSLVAVTAAMPTAIASIKAGAKCTANDYNRDTRIKVGSTTFACVGADSGYFWYPANSGGSSANQSNTSSTSTRNAILASPAQNFVAPGQALQSLNLSLGISLNNGTRPITVKELADKLYSATSRLHGSWLTKNDVNIGLQPGGGLYTFLAGLLSGPTAYEAICYELLLDGSKH